MFDLFGGNDDHDERVESQADQLSTLGYSNVRADHTSEYPDPDMRNGRVPDVTADSPFGRDPVIEVDSDSTTSARDQRQLDDLSSGLAEMSAWFRSTMTIRSSAVGSSLGHSDD